MAKSMSTHNQVSYKTWVEKHEASESKEQMTIEIKEEENVDQIELYGNFDAEVLMSQRWS